MNSPCSPVPAAGCSGPSSSGSAQSATSSGSPTAKRSSRSASKTGYWREPQYSAISVSSLSPVPLGNIAVLRMWLQQASPANLSASRASKPPQTTREICGPQRPMCFARFDPAKRSLRMSQASLLPDTASASSQTWPRSGSMRDGVCFQQPKSARPTSESGCSFWPTPRANDAEKRGDFANDRRNGLPAAAKYWPTPSATDYKGSVTGGGALMARRNHTRGVRLPEEVMRQMLPTPTASNTKAVHLRTGGRAPRSYLPTPGCPRPHDSQNTVGKFMPGQGQQDLTAAVAKAAGQLNPDWVEWLMGWPIGWSDLKPLVTGKSPSPSQKRGGN